MYRNIFIIDDSEIDVYIIKRLLRMRSFPDKAIHSFSYAREALEVLNDHIANKRFEQIPDLIFLDINMAEMSGLEFLQEFSTLPPELTESTDIIVLSSSDDQEDITASTSYKQVKRFVRKPLESLDILD